MHEKNIENLLFTT